MSDPPPANANGDDLDIEIAGPAREAPRSPFAARLTSRGRAQRLGTMASAILLAVLAALSSLAPVQNVLARLLGTIHPSPTPLLAPGADLFYLLPNPPGTTILIDGHPPARLAYPGDPAPLRLTRGRHQFSWHASDFPFQPLSCTASVPHAASDTCPFVTPALLRPGQTPTAYDQSSVAQIIGLRESLATLPNGQILALAAAVRTALVNLRASATVQPGQVYFFSQPGQPGQIVAATRPLRATLSISLAPSIPDGLPDPCLLYGGVDPCRFPGQNCVQLCTLFSISPPGATSPSSAANAPAPWLAAALVSLSWQYTTAAGQVLARGLPENGYSVQRVLLRITWDGALWHVAPIIGHEADLPAADDTLCIPARGWLSQSPFSYALFQGTASQLSITAASSPTLTGGCAVRIGGNSQLGPTLTPAPLFLERFGVLLAVNDSAHAFWPALPRADALAQTLAYQLAAPLNG